MPRRRSSPQFDRTFKAARSAAFETLETRRLLSAGKAFVGPIAPSVLPAPSRVEQTPLPRNLTDEELEWIRQNPDWATADTRAPTPLPTGPIDPVAEYEEMEGLVVSWMAHTANLAQIGRRVTLEGGGRYYVGVPNAGTQTSATTALINAGADMSKVTFFTLPLNSVWARDYGPRYVYEGDVRVITDHKYNRPTRTSDDVQPIAFGNLKKHQYYEIGINGTTLVHGGGNYHLDANGDAYATQLINNENPSLTQTQIQQIWLDYQNNNTTITQPFPTSVDLTQHIDMWMQIYDDNKVFISDFANPTGDVLVADNICEATATLMASRGYQVTRIPAFKIGSTHYTFANMVIFNDVVLLPQYNNGPGSAVSSQVLNTVQAAFGAGKSVYQINADSIVTQAGVFHCIVQHIPVHKGLPGANGGLAPTAYVRGQAGTQHLTPGQSLNIQWLTDDDAPTGATGVQSVDVLFSADGGKTFPYTIATSRPALGSFNWIVPGNITTSAGVIRVIARDSLNNTGFDDMDTTFTLMSNGIWTGNGDGVNWFTHANWSNNNLPTINDDVIINDTDNPTINVGGAVNVRSIQSSESLNVTGAVNVVQASSFASGATLTLGTGGTIGGTGSLTIDAGASVNVTGAGVTRIGVPLVIDGAASVALGGDKLLSLVGLTIHGGGHLDLHDNDLVLDYAGASQLDAIQSLINAGRAGGTWTSAGITSTAAKNASPANKTLGAIEASDYKSIYHGVTTFGGETIDDTAVLVKYTYYGDADFNGVVNFDDYSRIDSGFLNSRTGWMNGDFNGDGVVNFDDYALIDQSFLTQAPLPRPGALGRGGWGMA